jgi:CRP-like cAMP-binding protein
MPAIQLFIRAISRRDILTTAEQDLLLRLPCQNRGFARGETIVFEHSEPQDSCLVARGIAGREIVLPDGARQITALHVPGDFVDLHGLLLRRMDHGVIALTACQVTLVPHTALRKLFEASSHLMRLLWLSTLIDAANQRVWTAAMARLTAEERLAHMICDLYRRLEIVELATDNKMQIAVSQAVLADVLGLSAVHVNRTLQSLRRRRLVSWTGSEVTIHNFAELAELSKFDETYLSLMQTPR